MLKVNTHSENDSSVYKYVKDYIDMNIDDSVYWDVERRDVTKVGIGIDKRVDNCVDIEVGSGDGEIVQ